MARSSFFLLSLLLFALTSVKGQNTDLEKFFTDFVNEFNNLDETKDVSRVTDYLDEGFISERTLKGPLGSVLQETRDLKVFAAGLEELTLDREINSELIINDFNIEMKGDNAAIIKSSIGVKIDVDGKLGERSGIESTFLAAKKDGEWKFIRSQIERDIAQRNIGECYCKLNESGDYEYVSEVYYPTGFEYVRNSDIISVGQADGNKYISINYVEYPWLEDGTVLRLVDDEKIELGKTNKEEEAILLVLGQKYKNTCLSITKK